MHTDQEYLTKDLNKLAKWQSLYKNDLITRADFSERLDKFMLRHSIKNRKYVFELMRNNNTILKGIEEIEEQNEVKKEFFSFVSHIEKYCCNIPPGGIEIMLNGEKFTMPAEDVRDIVNCIQNAYDRFRFAEKNKLPLERDRLRIAMLFQKLDHRISMSNTPASLYKLSLVYRSLKKEYGNIYGISAVRNICRALKPDITDDEIIALVNNHSS